MNRRELLKTLPAAAVLPAALAAADAPGLTVRMSEPGNLEGDFSAVKAFLTPSDQFFVRSHFAVPTIDMKTWTLEITGDVAKPAKLIFDDLLKLGEVTMPITMECAGNGRVFLTPATRGLQWQQGAVGTAEWTGVPLAKVLEHVGVNKTAQEVILVGADKGVVADPATPGAIAFDRSVPIEKAMKAECLLAVRMNGQPLTPAHGFPVRAVIGGYYGMASIKWLSRIVVTDKPYDGFWQTFDYSHWQRRDGGLATLVPVGAMQPKVQIARPTFGEVVPPGVAYTIRGAAWAGEHAVNKVEVSTDGGTTWHAVTLTTDAKPFCWRLWEYEWRTPATLGPLKLLCRCIDERGHGQPEKRDPDRRTYVINHWVPIEITIGEARK